MKNLSIAIFAGASAFLIACGGVANVSVNTSNSNSNSASRATATPAASTAPQASPASANANTTSAPLPKKDDDTEVEGQLQVGKTDSVILYFGGETGDYAGYCFENDSDAGKAILAACKDKQPCHITGTVDNSACKVPGLEADLSASGRIISVTSAKPGAAKAGAPAKK